MNLEKAVEGSTILITGGTGSFGYQMTKRLLQIKNTHIIIYSRDEDKHRVMQNYFDDCRVSFVLGDVRDYDRLEQSLKDVHIVMHAGALKQIPSVEFNPMEAIKTNTTSAFNILKASDKMGVEKVVAISTDKACEPLNSYGLSKALMEKIIIGDEIWSDTTIASCVRYGNVLGSRGSVLPVWDKCIEESKPIPITNYDMRRFFITLDQATDLILFSLQRMKGKEIFVRKAPAIKITDLANVYADLKLSTIQTKNQKSKLKNRSYPLRSIGIRSGEKLDEILISKHEISRTKELDKDYFVIRRQDNKGKNCLDNEYSSATTNQLNQEQIMKLLRGMNWIR